MEQLLGFLQTLIELYGGSQGWLVSVVAIVGSLRIFIKPIMSLLLAYVEFTPSKRDDELYDDLEKGNVMKTLLFLLDWIASIKFKK